MELDSARRRSHDAHGQPAQPVARRDAGQPIEHAEQAMDLEPRIAGEPFVGAFAGQGDLVAMLMHRASEPQQGRAGRVDHRRLGRARSAPDSFAEPPHRRPARRPASSRCAARRRRPAWSRRACGSMIWMVKVGIGVPRIFAAIATTRLESMPPVRYETTGTSARSRRSTAPSKHAIEFIDQRLRIGGRNLPAPDRENRSASNTCVRRAAAALSPASWMRRYWPGCNEVTPAKQVAGPGTAKKLNA